MSPAGTRKKENAMNASRTQPRSRFSVANAVTAIIAAWFVIGMGSIAAEAAQPVNAANTQPGAVSLTADGRMKLTVVAQKPVSSPTRVAATARPAKG
jgi:uncharacterized membrane protein